MVYSKTRWKWHECLKVRDEMINNDSEYENDEYNQQGWNHEQHPDDICIKQQKLKEEAKLALVFGAKMARMQVQIERRGSKTKRSPLYDVVGINTDGGKPFTRELLEQMNIGQLQVIINDLYDQIEVNNEQLVNLLIERDSRSMEQDSILVDIEDLTKRLQERTANLLKQSSSDQPTPCVPIVKRPEKSLFQNLLRKAMFI